jgi:hypothetical protein
MSFGTFRGKQVYLMHPAQNPDTHSYQLPFICRMKLPVPYHYLEFLQRKVVEGYESLSLRLLVEDIDDNIWVRRRGSRRYEVRKGILEERLNRFKKLVKLRLALKRLRTRYRARLLHEEIVMKAWHPSRIQRLLDMGYDLDHILEC